MKNTPGKLLLLILTVVLCQGCDPEHRLPSTEPDIGQDDKGGGGGAVIEPTWESIYTNLVSTTCLECHSSEGGKKPKDDIDLISYESMNAAFTWPPMISPGDPSNSKFYLSIADGSMPDKGPKVPQNVVETVRQWILNGAKEFED